MADIQSVMWQKAGVVSDAARLLQAAATLESMRQDRLRTLDRADRFSLIEAGNLVLTAELVARAKLARQETRCAHGRSDFPDPSDEWVRHVTLTRDQLGAISVGVAPVARN